MALREMLKSIFGNNTTEKPAVEQKNPSAAPVKRSEEQRGAGPDMPSVMENSSPVHSILHDHPSTDSHSSVQHVFAEVEVGSDMETEPAHAIPARTSIPIPPHPESSLSPFPTPEILRAALAELDAFWEQFLSPIQIPSPATEEPTSQIHEIPVAGPAEKWETADEVIPIPAPVSLTEAITSPPDKNAGLLNNVGVETPALTTQITIEEEPDPENRWEWLRRFHPAPDSFLHNARHRQNKTHDAVPPVPLHAYWTTYSNLDAAQIRWYYYWRDQFRRGEALPTDLSYLFLHIYEILHGIGFDSPTAAFIQLRRLHIVYREQHPQLDRYLVDWLDDFIHYYEVDADEARSWLQESGAYATGDRLLQHLLDQGELTQLPPELFRQLITYRPSENKFYRQSDNKAALNQIFNRAIALTDQFYREKNGVSIFVTLRPAMKRAVYHLAFQGAVFEGPLFSYVTEGDYPYLEDGRLSLLLTQVVRQAENLARQEARFKTMLRGIDLPADLSAYLTTNLFPKVVPTRQIQIDPQKFAHLQQESAEIRTRLAEETPGELEKVNLPEVPAIPSPTPPGLSYQLPSEIPAGQLTDIDALASILNDLTPTARTLLEQLSAARFELEERQVTLPTGTFLSTIVDNINEASQVRLGDMLIVLEGTRLVVVEDYRDELEFLLTENAVSQKDSLPVEEPWSLLKSRLSPVQQSALAKILSAPTSIAELNRFALSQGSMGSSLVEEINEAAQDTLGDILIDPYADPLSIDENYHTDLLRLLNVPR